MVAVTHREVMTTSSVSDQVVVVSDERVLRAAVAAYLGRYRGESRVHTGSDLKVFLTWCAGQELDPLSLGRAEVERYVLVGHLQFEGLLTAARLSDHRNDFAFSRDARPA